ncbi:TetR/AcrR family transcriptional regulator [[Mycobacterium] vasticus]|uniref:TetR family transcriptional regulator n=1 Tax=[Mycobacterium] vasticus TaxID=2875777 RepID=A0ABU5Z310_9MYCO|nr:TetR family transcriptional regulator [Mycolicibacter sp. MYC017]MEB3071787.1 TetR family transcriptional regulator [Mycolicibacter sp. MYC017]
MANSAAPLPFARARSAAQRQDRLSQLTAVTRELLSDIRAATLTLGDVAAAAGMAKSGILRYCGSREALLLRAMHEEHLDWIDALAGELARSAPAAALARTLAARPVLCDLIAASPVLIGRLGPDEMRVLAAQANDAQRRLGAALRPGMPLIGDQLPALTAAVHAFVGTTWAWTNPDAAQPMVTDFETTVLRLLQIFISGLHATG